MTASNRYVVPAILLAIAMSAVACGGNDKAPPVVAPRLTAEEAILQVSQNFATSSESKRLLAPPSQLAIHQRQARSQLSLAKSGPSERLQVTERFEYRNGRVIECTAESVRPLKASYRFENDSALVKLDAPQTALNFRCAGGTPAELVPSVEASAIELVLRDESLVVVAPSTDQRRFLPTD
jgi:hypothetical protein